MEVDLAQKTGSNKQKNTIMIPMLPNPENRLKELKKIERNRNKTPVPKMPKHEIDISYAWMSKFEEMHQHRMELFGKMNDMKCEAIQKNERIESLLLEVRKLNEVIQWEKEMAIKDKRIIHQQQLTIEKQRKETQQLRKNNWRWSRVVRRLKQKSNVLATHEVKSEEK